MQLGVSASRLVRMQWSAATWQHCVPCGHDLDAICWYSKLQLFAMVCCACLNTKCIKAPLYLQIPLLCRRQLQVAFRRVCALPFVGCCAVSLLPTAAFCRLWTCPFGSAKAVCAILVQGGVFLYAALLRAMGGRKQESIWLGFT